MKIKLALIYLTAVMLASCVSTMHDRKIYDLTSAGPEDIKAAFAENAAALRSVSGRFDFSYSTSTGRIQSSGYIYLTGRDTVYIEIKGIAGETEAVLFADKDSVKAENYPDKISIRTRFEENALKRLTGINIGLSELRSAILTFRCEYDSISITERKGPSLNARMFKGGASYSFITLDNGLNITECADFIERDMIYRKQYDYFTDEKGVSFPRRIRIVSFNPPEKITIFFTSLKTNIFPELDI